MSHNWNCPTDWEAKREGERAFEYGRSRYSSLQRGMTKFGRWGWKYAMAIIHSSEDRRRVSVSSRPVMRTAPPPNVLSN